MLWCFCGSLLEKFPFSPGKVLICHLKVVLTICNYYYFLFLEHLSAPNLPPKDCGWHDKAEDEMMGVGN